MLVEHWLNLFNKVLHYENDGRSADDISDCLQFIVDGQRMYVGLLLKNVFPRCDHVSGG
jgi:hypothetical protein